MSFANRALRAFGFLAMVAVALGVDAQTPIVAGARLDTSGRWLIDGQGRIVIIHGFNMINKLPPYTLSAAGFREEDADIIQREGFNGVRVGVIYQAVEPSPGQYDDRYLDDIEKSVRMLAQRGIWSLIDFHQDAWGPTFKGQGMPEWATLTDGLATTPNPGFPAVYFTAPAISRAFDNFWENKPGPGGVGLQDRYAAAWAHVATRLAKVPGVMGYELMNEPWPGSPWAECRSKLGCPEFDRKYSAFNTKMTQAIQQRDPNTIVFYEPNVLFDTAVPTYVPRPVTGSRVAFSFHPYSRIARGLGLADQYAALTGTALLASEWGATTEVPLIKAIAKDMDDAMMSWLYWAWANKPGYLVVGGDLGDVSEGGPTHGMVYDLAGPREEPNLHQGRLDALARPYPRAVAGTPMEFSFDPGTRVFNFRYVPRPVPAAPRAIAANAQTEVFLPERQYKNGYKVTVSGATVVSSPGERVLRLANQSDASSVTVRVEPATGQ